MHYMVWLLLSAICFAAGEYLTKSYALSANRVVLVSMVAAYNLGIMFWMPAIAQKPELSTVGVIWAVLCLLMTVLVGVLAFGERLDILRIVGITLSILAVAILSRS